MGTGDVTKCMALTVLTTLSVLWGVGFFKAQLLKRVYGVDWFVNPVTTQIRCPLLFLAAIGIFLAWQSPELLPIQKVVATVVGVLLGGAFALWSLQLMADSSRRISRHRRAM